MITFEQILAVLVAKDLEIQSLKEMLAQRDSLIAQQAQKIAESEK